MRSYHGVWDKVLDDARQLHAAGQLFENVGKEKVEVTEPVGMLAEPEEQDVDDLENNVPTEHTEDVERDHLRGPEVEWLELLVGETGEVPPLLWQRLVQTDQQNNRMRPALGARP